MLARSQAKGDAVSGDKILLTGGAGYIGSHTAVALAEAGYAPVVLDNFSNAKPSVLERLEMILGVPVALERGDILDRAFLADVFTRHEFGAVIHFAARKAVGESVARPMDYFETNCCGLTALLRTMEASGVRNLVFSFVGDGLWRARRLSGPRNCAALAYKPVCDDQVGLGRFATGHG